MSPEMLLICDCCKSNVDSARVSALVRDVSDWERLFTLATWHRVRPQVSHAFSFLQMEDAPASIRATLQAANRIAVGRVLAVVYVLERVLKVFSEREIGCFVLKGPALALAAYGDLTSRECDDLDLFVRPRDVHAAAIALRQLGFEPDAAMGGDERRFVEINHQLAFSHAETKVVCELHWSFQEERFSGARITIEDWWSRLVPLRLGESVFYSLAPCDMLIFLAAHGLKHRWERFKWVCDIHKVAKLLPSGSRDRIIREAATQGLSQAVLFAFELAAELDEGTRRKAVRSRAKQVADRWEDCCTTELTFSAWLQLRLQDGIRARCRYLLTICFIPNSADFRATNGRGGFLGVLYVYRVFRVICMAARATVNRVKILA